MDAAEAAVAVVQQRLMESLKARADLAAELALTRRDVELERSKRETEVRRGRCGEVCGVGGVGGMGGVRGICEESKACEAGKISDSKFCPSSATAV